MTVSRASYVREFDYVPVAPFILQEVAWSTADGQSFERQTFKGAVGLFAQRFLPIRWGMMCSLIDSTDRIVLQYFAKHEMTVPEWWGVAATFAELERIGAANPVDLAIWETIAKEQGQ